MGGGGVHVSRLGRCSRHFHGALKALNQKEVRAVLDIGCGDGRTFHLLDRFDGAFRVGLDIDAGELTKARSVCAPVSASGSALPFGNGSFDLVVEFHTFHHIPDYGAAIAEAHRCLRSGGHFLMVEAVNDNPVFRTVRDLHPVARKMPIESNFMFRELLDTLEKHGFAIRSRRRFGLFFEFTLGGIPHAPALVKHITSAMDSGLERLFGTKYCASCVVLAQKR